MESDSKTYVTIELENIIEMTADDLELEGDVTAETVVDLIADHGGLTRVLDDWCLLPGIVAEITVVRPNPAYSGPNVLFEEHSVPRTITSTARIVGR